MTNEAPLIGTILAGKYEVVEQVGIGGMGSVYKALQKPFDRPVAVKILVAGLAGDESVLKRFANEALIISKLHRPHTLTLIDFGQAEDGRLYLVTELLQGAPLNHLLAEGPIGPDRTRAMLEQVASSLEEAHQLGIVHRDLKPANLFVEDDSGKDFYRVLDFGIAKLREGPSLTADGSFIGTPAYVSPEQARGEDIGPCSDIYSLGVIAYECLTGQPPFTAKDPLSVLYKHIHDDPVPVGERADVPEDLAELVDSMLSKLPSDRPQSAAEVIAAIRQSPDRPTSGPSRGPLPDAQPEPVAMSSIDDPTHDSTLFPVTHRRRPLFGILFATLAVVIATSAYFEFQSTDVPEAVPIPTPAIDERPEQAQVVEPEPPVDGEPVVEPEPAVDEEPDPGIDEQPKEVESPPRPKARRVVARRRKRPPPPSPPPPPESSMTGRVRIEVWTTGGRSLRAEIFIDGKPIAKTAPAAVSLTHGRHELRIEAPGFPPKTKVVDVAGDSRVRFVADL